MVEYWKVSQRYTMAPGGVLWTP